MIYNGSNSKTQWVRFFYNNLYNDERLESCYLRYETAVVLRLGGKSPFCVYRINSDNEKE